MIINNASDWAFIGAPAVVAYCTSKGAVVQMTRAMAIDHAGEKIRINAVCPGDTFVDRWLKDGFYRTSGAVSEAEARQSDLPIGRVAETIEIARAVLFLASDDSSFMTGTALLVDGGSTARSDSLTVGLYSLSAMVYNITPVAIARFNEVTRPCMGIFSISSHIADWDEVNPSRSLPISRISGQSK